MSYQLETSILQRASQRASEVLSNVNPTSYNVPITLHLKSYQLEPNILHGASQLAPEVLTT